MILTPCKTVKSEMVAMVKVDPEIEADELQKVLSKLVGVLQTTGLVDMADKIHWRQAYDWLILHRIYEVYQFTDYMPVNYDLRDLN